jgi:SAM-dependent methyltransferase
MSEPSFLHDTRHAYGAIAEDYAERFHAELADKPLDRGLLRAFAEEVRAAGDSPVADIGCGPGHITAHLNALGLNAFGIDLAPEMVVLARRTHPRLRFDEGSMLALEVADGSLSGIVAFYSIIHLPDEQLPAVFSEFHRVLVPGGQLLVSFQTGEERLHRTDAYGHAISLDYYLRPAELVAELLGKAGLAVHARLLREPYPEVEQYPRAYLMAVKG